MTVTGASLGLVLCAAASTTPPPSNQTLPLPRSPVTRRRPVLFVDASKRKTSISANVSSVPCRATAASEPLVVPPLRRDFSPYRHRQGRTEPFRGEIDPLRPTAERVNDGRVSSSGRRGQLAGGGVHRIDGRVDTGPEREGERRLVDQHPDTVDRTGAALAGGPEQRRVDRVVHEVDHDLWRPEHLDGHGQSPSPPIPTDVALTTISTPSRRRRGRRPSTADRRARPPPRPCPPIG